jgi:glycosyltransferase involved in cell wall biosynthesis
MNIFFDARWTRFEVHDGISRYTANLLEALAKIHAVTMIIYDDRQLDLLPKGVPHVKLANPMSPNELFTARKLNQLGADIVFSPMQIMGAWGRRYKLIFTLHDVIYYQFPTPPHQLPFSARITWRLFHLAKWPQRWLLNQADYVVTVSQTSKKLIQAMRLTDRKIGVVYNAPSLKPMKPGGNYKHELIYVGSFMEYKNVELLMRAMKFLPDYKLHLVSRITQARMNELENLLDDKDQALFWNGASDEQYNKLLKSALALVSASRAEGFGLPLLEAMSQGVPVVATNMPIFHEVCEQAGTYFDSNSPESFAKAVQSLEDPEQHRKMRELGEVQSTKFNWDSSAQQLLKIMKQLHKQDLLR